MITVACVLRSGPEYKPKHVQALHAGVAQFLKLPHRFVCLSDVILPNHIEHVPLKHDWPGWWSKIELFRPGLFEGPVVYFDLDTFILGPLDDIVAGHRFTMLKNFWADEQGRPEQVGSGVMAWDLDLSDIYNRFRKHPAGFMRAFNSWPRWGDQAFIHENASIEPERWQSKYPGRIVSFKKHVVPRKQLPQDASVVCFHGEPRPWKISTKQRQWLERQAA